MATMLTLYRGDAEKISRFDLSKTDKMCSFGQGVYLTDNVTVAHSYRTKGAKDTSRYYNPTLFNSSAKDRPDALNKAFLNYVDRYISNNRLGVSHCPRRAPKKHAALSAQLREVFDQLVLDKKIVAEYGAGYQPSGKRYLTVTQEIDGFDIGYVTEFSFLRSTFEKSIVNVSSRRIDDHLFWEILWEHKFFDFGMPEDTLDRYVSVNTKYLSLGARRLEGADAWNRMRRILKPYGYRGFEYDGGVITNAAIRHRAFVLWDNDFVNDHKVKRFR